MLFIFERMLDQLRETSILTEMAIDDAFGNLIRIVVIKDSTYSYTKTIVFYPKFETNWKIWFRNAFHFIRNKTQWAQYFFLLFKIIQ